MRPKYHTHSHKPESWSATTDMKKRVISINSELYEVARVAFTADCAKPSITDLTDAALIVAAPTLYHALGAFIHEPCERLDGTCEGHPTVIPCKFCAARRAYSSVTYGGDDDA